jgi:hypothetical protein
MAGTPPPEGRTICHFGRCGYRRPGVRIFEVDFSFRFFPFAPLFSLNVTLPVCWSIIPKHEAYQL